MSVNKNDQKYLHPDAVHRMNIETSLRLEKLRARRAFITTGVSSGLVITGIASCVSNEETAATPNDPYNKDKTGVGIVSGLFATIAAIPAIFGATKLYNSMVRMEAKQQGTIPKFGSYDLRCMDVMTFEERAKIVQEVYANDIDEASRILRAFEKQELDKRATRRANREKGGKIRSQYSRRTGHPEPENKPEI
jgi:hypothetical protein